MKLPEWMTSLFSAIIGGLLTLSSGVVLDNRKTKEENLRIALTEFPVRYRELEPCSIDINENTSKLISKSTEITFTRLREVLFSRFGVNINARGEPLLPNSSAKLEQVGKELANENSQQSKDFTELRAGLNHRIYECQLSVLRTRFLVKILKEKSLFKPLEKMKEDLNQIQNEFTVEALVSGTLILDKMDEFERKGTLAQLENAKKSKQIDVLQNITGAMVADVLVTEAKRKHQPQVEKILEFQKTWQVSLNELEEKILT